MYRTTPRTGAEKHNILPNVPCSLSRDKHAALRQVPVLKKHNMLPNIHTISLQYRNKDAVLRHIPAHLCTMYMYSAWYRNKTQYGAANCSWRNSSCCLILFQSFLTLFRDKDAVLRHVPGQMCRIYMYILFRDKDAVLRRVPVLKKHNMFATEDLTKAVREGRKHLTK